MKKALIVFAVAIGTLSIPFAYSTLHGYTRWYWRNHHSKILVDGRPVSGYVHESKRKIIVTRRETPKPHSYLIVLGDQYTATRLDCGDWFAPPFFVFPIGDVNPPCLSTIGDEAAYNEPDAPVGPITIKGTVLEFHTKDGKLVTVNR